MGAGFLIINRAIKNAVEKRREEEKREAKLRADGYVRELILKNPNECYAHYYRNIKKSQDGFLWSIVSIFVLSTSLLSDKMSILTIVPFTIFLLIGLFKFLNKEEVLSNSSKESVREGYIYLKTKSCSIYEFEWIKKDKNNVHIN